MRFDGQVAIITGAGDGLGRAYALWLAERGAAIVVNNRHRPGMPSSADAVVAEIVARGGKAVSDNHNVEDPVAGKAMVKAAFDNFGRVDIVICNAAMTTLVPFDQLDLAEFRRVVDVNLWGTLYPIHAAWPHMIEQGYGRVVLTTSTGGMYGFSKSTPYSTTKASMLGLARALTLDVPDGVDIKVNIIAPSAMTKMLRGLAPDELETVIPPEKVAPAVGWMASKACNISGAILFAAAGRVMRLRVVEGQVVDIPDEDFTVDWVRLNAVDNVFEPAIGDVFTSLSRLMTPAV